MVLTQDDVAFDTKSFGDKLLKWLTSNSPNFKLLCNSEVSEVFVQNGTVTGVKIMGKGQIECDAVVFCTGASSARVLK